MTTCSNEAIAKALTHLMEALALVCGACGAAGKQLEQLRITRVAEGADDLDLDACEHACKIAYLRGSQQIREAVAALRGPTEAEAPPEAPRRTNLRIVATAGESGAS